MDILFGFRLSSGIKARGTRGGGLEQLFGDLVQVSFRYCS